MNKKFSSFAIHHATVSRFILEFDEKNRPAHREINFHRYRELLSRQRFMGKKRSDMKKKKREKRKKWKKWKKRRIVTGFKRLLFLRYRINQFSQKRSRRDAWHGTRLLTPRPEEGLITFHKFSAAGVAGHESRPRPSKRRSKIRRRNSLPSPNRWD